MAEICQNRPAGRKKNSNILCCSNQKVLNERKLANILGDLFINFELDPIYRDSSRIFMVEERNLFRDSNSQILLPSH